MSIRIAVVAAAAAEELGNSGAVQIKLAAWEPDSPFAQRLRKTPAGELYTWYLDEREAERSP